MFSQTNTTLLSVNLKDNLIRKTRGKMHNIFNVPIGFQQYNALIIETCAHCQMPITDSSAWSIYSEQFIWSNYRNVMCCRLILITLYVAKHQIEIQFYDICGYVCRMKCWYPNYSSYPNYVIYVVISSNLYTY